MCRAHRSKCNEAKYTSVLRKSEISLLGYVAVQDTCSRGVKLPSSKSGNAYCLINKKNSYGGLKA